MKQFIIKEELLQKIGSYLLQKPYNEVALFIQELQKLEVIKDENPEAEKKS